MMQRLDNTRRIRSPRGRELNARSWQAEAPLRMLMNNLDPEVAEAPEELVVYGGIGRAARGRGRHGAILGVEWPAAAQGCDFHAPLRSSPPPAEPRVLLRARVPTLEEDRYLAPDIPAATAPLAAGALAPGATLPQVCA